MANEAEAAGFSGIDFLRTRSLTNLVQAEMERLIVEGEMKPNARINENALAQKLGVSRGPIREAANALAAIGLIEIIPNRGLFVRSLDDDGIRIASEARAGTFAFIAMLAAEKASPQDRGILVDFVERMEEIARTSDVHEYYPVNLAFHAELGRIGGNERLAQTYQNLVRELHIHRYRALSSKDTLAVSNTEHRAIVDAIVSGAAAEAFAAGRAHIMNGYDRSVTVKAERQAADAMPLMPLRRR